MDNNFELTQEEIDQIDARTRLYVSGLYQQMLSGDQDAEKKLGKICDGALVYHRDHCLSPIDAVYAKNDLSFISERYDGWILEAIDHQKSALDFEQEEYVAGYGGVTTSLREQKEIEAHLAVLDHDPTYTVEDYIAEVLSYDEDDLDYDEDFTAADVCRL